MERIICKTQNFPDGQKIMETEIIYDSPVRDLPQDCFSVRGRTVESVGIDGCAVTLHLREREPFATVLPTRAEEHQGEALQCRPVELWVRQTKPFGNHPAWGDYRKSTEAIEPVVSDFVQGERCGLRYSLFSPNTESGKRYPMVVFLHDARPCGDDPKLTLCQGSGAVCWAAEAWQSEHPCYVLAPQIPKMMANDEFEVTEDLEKIYDLIRTIREENAVDRVFLTGQSMGCMGACELLCRHTAAFDGALLIAGQWAPERMKVCRYQKLWVLVSQNDVKAFPGMNAVMDAIESTGQSVSRAVWDAKTPLADLNACASIQAPQCNIHYTVFRDSSVVPDWEPAHPGTNHEYTWRTAYTIDGLKKWLFEQ